MAARSIWTGSISFGLVNIPVRLYLAVREQPVRFHLLHDQDKVRLRRKMVCPADNKEVHAEHTVRGYEVGPEQYVIVTDEELESLAPEKSRTIEITDFVDLADIDPLYFDRPYYILPDRGAAKPYALLLEAMTKSKKVGIARFVMRNKEWLAAIRPLGKALCLESMHFGEEIVPLADLSVGAMPKTSDRELKAAQDLVESMTSPFEPKRYKDEYKERVLELVEKKSKGQAVVTAPRETPKGRAVDLMEALAASVARARGTARTARPVRPKRAPRRRAKAAAR